MGITLGKNFMKMANCSQSFFNAVYSAIAVAHILGILGSLVLAKILIAVPCFGQPKNHLVSSCLALDWKFDGQK